MAHLGWIFGIGGYIGGILTMLYGPVGKYSLDQANELKELIVKIRRSISDLKQQSANPQAKEFSTYASDLKSKLELIRGYDFIRHLHLVQLPPKENIYEAAKLSPRLAGGVQAFGHPLRREEASFNAKKILDLLA